ncbi:hypothetical protein [Conexibacter arvalis]|uniref:Uncharacterized protein n=1 Tax=Conexibacter arvalis TaxID=912552 RepID=A0A840IBL4_9ACTN|nr:hypothetical protein [Conexibacter arvalis]MBB4661641.1 hypothetical protein [Conexibacter arvalis]
MRVFQPVRIVALALVAAGCGLLAHAGAASARTQVAITGGVTPTITGFPTKPKNVKLTIAGRMIGDDVEGVFPATTTKIVWWFTHGARVNGRYFRHCDPRRLAAARGNPSACPRASRIGGGWVVATAISVTARVRIDIYNGKGGKSMIFYFQTLRPVVVNDMLVAPFQTLKGGRHGFKLTMRIPDGLQELAPGMVTSVREFTATVGGMTTTARIGRRREKRGFIETMACPPGALVTARGEFSFRTISPITVDSYLGCGQAPPFPPEFPRSQLGSS